MNRATSGLSKCVLEGMAIVLLFMGGTVLACGAQTPANGPLVLKAESFKHYLDAFNAQDQELYPGYITNGAAWSFLETRIPLFECPDKDIEGMYYFRWWSYRKHIKLTPDGFIITEFLPDVPWAGKDDSNDCAAGHHIYEGRWLADPKYVDDYSLFWFRKGGDPRLYSTWLADALWARYLVNGNVGLVQELLPDLIENYDSWEKGHAGLSGLFLQIDDRDGMEMSISGNGYRPTINSYLYGDAVAIANIADLAGRSAIASQYRAKAADLKRLVQEKLWNTNAQFFEVLKQYEHSANVRELQGYTPWYFNLPDTDKSVAWRQLMDSNGFYAPFGPSTAERRSPSYAIAYSGHECQWNGPSWPYATSITLTALANLLTNYRQNVVTKQNYFDLLEIYTKSQSLKLPSGKVVPWIDEDLDPYTGSWLARTILKRQGSEIQERGKDYNHSTYCDLIITGLVGLRPRADNIIELDPLIPDAVWDYFCLDNVHYHGHILTIFYDKAGKRYGKGKGFHVLDNGHEIASSRTLGQLRGQLNIKGKTQSDPMSQSAEPGDVQSSRISIGLSGSSAGPDNTSPVQTKREP